MASVADEGRGNTHSLTYSLTHSHTHRTTTVTLAAHARRGLMISPNNTHTHLTIFHRRPRQGIRPHFEVPWTSRRALLLSSGPRDSVQSSPCRNGLLRWVVISSSWAEPLTRTNNGQHTQLSYGSSAGWADSPYIEAGLKPKRGEYHHISCVHTHTHREHSVF